MIRTVHSVRMLRVVALVLGISLLLWSVGLPGSFHLVKAASITNASDTISDSDLGVTANHTIRFTTPNGLLAGDSITLTFPAGAGEFVLGQLDFNDMDLFATSERLLGTSPSGATWGVATTSTTITFTSGTDTIASSTVVTIEIGDNATSGATGDTFITNPTSADSYGIDIAVTGQDSGQVRVAIIDNVLVTAAVDTSLEFSITGLANGTTINGSPTTTATTTTATSVPFETLTSNVSKTLAQALSVETNAAAGFVVTVEQDGNLASPSGADIDGFIDGAYTDTPTAWVAPGNLIADERTYGHWAITTEDTDLQGAGVDFGSDEWASASTTPRAIFAHDGPADGLTAGEGATEVGYQIQITGLQEAASDYSTVLTFIATPTF